MEDLNNDSNNYLGVWSTLLPATDDEAKCEAPAAKKLATDLGIYNRGSVPHEPKTRFGDKVRYYYSCPMAGSCSRGSEARCAAAWCESVVRWQETGGSSSTG